MAKASSPLRIQAELMAAATATGDVMHRSAAEQIEFWADLGRRVSGTLSPQEVLDVISGLARVKVDPVKSVPVDPDAVFVALTKRRKKGSLSKSIGKGAVRYQMCQSQPGLLEQVAANGEVTPGSFSNGRFVPRG